MLLSVDFGGGSDEYVSAGAAESVTRRADDLYRALAPSVLGYLRGRGVPDPEDLLGEVFYQVARDIGRFEGGAEDLRRWVFTIARNRVIDDARRRKRRPVVVSSDLPEQAVVDGEPLDEGLLAALQELTPLQREVVILRFVADLPLETVARLVRRPVSAVKALQRRAMKNLAEVVSPPA